MMVQTGEEMNFQYKAIVNGKNGIQVKVVADSINKYNQKRITTFELSYHRYIHGELLTHRLFSRNSSSSRAIPVGKMEATPVAVPIHWGKNQAGMKAKEELPRQELAAAKLRWHTAMTEARTSAGLLSEYGLHKQVTNRLTEPFQMMRTVLTATELDNFFWLRIDEDAQPEIIELAKCMHQAIQESTPQVLEADQWHTPYVPNNHTEDKTEYFLWEDDNQRGVSEEEALMISASACGQVSYRNLNTSYDKAIDIYRKLVGGKKIHASPYEHQALCLSTELPVFDPKQWPHGVTHIDKDGAYWSGNFKGWVQHRQLFKGHTCNNFQLES